MPCNDWFQGGAEHFVREPAVAHPKHSLAASANPGSPGGVITTTSSNMTFRKTPIKIRAYVFYHVPLPKLLASLHVWPGEIFDSAIITFVAVSQ